MIKNPVLTVWLRLFCVVLIFFVFYVALCSQPIRTQTVNIGKVLLFSARVVLLGPAIPLSWHNKFLSILVAAGFWCALLGTACLSRKGYIRCIFYVLLGVYIVFTAIGIWGEILMGLIAMAHAS